MLCDLYHLPYGLIPVPEFLGLASDFIYEGMCSAMVDMHASYERTFLVYAVIYIFFQMARTCWWYYFSKFTEFFDTVSDIRQPVILQKLLCKTIVLINTLQHYETYI